MGRTYISAHFMPDSRDLPVGADALVGPRLPPSQRQRKEKQGVSGPSPGLRFPQGYRVLSKLLRRTANHPSPAAWRYALARTDPPWRFFLLDRPRPVLFLSRTKREWGVESSGDHRTPPGDHRSPLRSRPDGCICQDHQHGPCPVPWDALTQSLPASHEKSSPPARPAAGRPHSR